MPIFDVLAPKENNFFSELVQGAQSTIAQDLQVLLSQTVIFTRFSLDYNTPAAIKTNFKSSFVVIASKWEGDVSGVSFILVRRQDAKAMCHFLMMEPVTTVREVMEQPLTDEDMETFKEISNQVNGSFDNGLRKNIKFNFHVSFGSLSTIDFTDPAADLATLFPAEGYVYSRSQLKIADFPDNFVLQLFPLELIRGISSLQFKEIAAEAEQREQGNLWSLLLVDTDEVARKILKNYLKDTKYVTIDAKDGLEALGILRKQKIDAIIMEIDMPSMNGIQVCQRIKANPNTRNIPVIFCSAKSTKENITNAIINGGQDFLVKPLDKEITVQRIQKLLPTE